MCAFSLLVLRQDYACLLPAELLAQRLQQLIQDPEATAARTRQLRCVDTLNIPTQTFAARIVQARSSEPSLRGSWHSAAAADSAKTTLKLVVYYSPASLILPLLLGPLLFSLALVGLISKNYWGAATLLAFNLLLVVTPWLEMRRAQRYFERALPLRPLADS